MRFATERISVDIYNEAMELLKAHHEEVGMYGEINPDVFTYLKSECWVFTAREDTKLVGYGVYVIAPHLHYKDIMVAHQDLLFIHPEFRKGLAGLKFLKFQEKELKRLKVDMIFQSTKRSRDLSKLYGRLGYKETDILFSKEI